MKSRRVRSRKIKQRGAGFFSWLRGLFTRKKTTAPMPIAPVQATRTITRRPATTRPATTTTTAKRGFFNFFRTKKNKNKKNVIPNVKSLPLEKMGHGFKRMFVFLYKKMRPDVVIPEGTFLTTEQRDELRQAVKRAMEENMTLEQIAEEVFKTTSLDQLDREIRIEERGINGKKILYPGTPNAMRSDSYGGYLDRYINPILRSDSNEKYKFNTEKYICADPKGVNVKLLKKPITSLGEEINSEGRCVYIAKSPEQFKKYTNDVNKAFGENINVRKEQIVFPYIILHPGFYGKNIPDNDFVFANNLLEVEVFKDALNQKKVLEVEPHLAAVLRKEAPDLWKKSGLDVKIITTSQLNKVTAEDLKQGNVVIFDIEYLSEPQVDVVSNIPFNPFIKQGIEDGKLVYMDPYSMYLFRKEQPILYTSAFGSQNMNMYYEKSPIEQLVITFLQAYFIVDTFLKGGINRKSQTQNIHLNENYLYLNKNYFRHIQLNDYDNDRAYYEQTPMRGGADTITLKNRLSTLNPFTQNRGTKTAKKNERPKFKNEDNQYKLKSLLKYYSADLSDISLSDTLRAPFQQRLNSPQWRDLLKIQEKIPHEVSESINTTDKLNALLESFIPEGLRNSIAAEQEAAEFAETLEASEQAGVPYTNTNSEIDELESKLEREKNQTKKKQLANALKTLRLTKELAQTGTTAATPPQTTGRTLPATTKNYKTPEQVSAFNQAYPTLNTRRGRVAQMRQKFEQQKTNTNTITPNTRTRKNRKARKQKSRR